MRILLVGSGNRAKAYATFLKDEITYVSDVDCEKSKMLIKEYSLINAVSIQDYKTCGDVDAIIIAVPDYVHEEVIDWAFGENVPILLEKPVAVTGESLERIHKKGAASENGIILGFTLRYTFMYKKILELLKKNAIGEIISVEAAETLDPVHAAKFFRRWHRFSENSGGLLNTKCSHDMDMINQIIPGRPRYISSFGSNKIFNAGKGEDKCTEDCIEYSTCRFVDMNVYKYSSADTLICPYNVSSDIVDHQVVAMEFDSGTTAVFTVSMHSDKGDRHVHIHGTTGSIKASFHNQKVFLLKTGEKNLIFEPESTSGSHGGGDEVLCREFLKCIKLASSENQLEDGITASAMALAADESRKSGKVVDMTLFADYMYNKK